LIDYLVPLVEPKLQVESSEKNVDGGGDQTGGQLNTDTVFFLCYMRITSCCLICLRR